MKSILQIIALMVLPSLLFAQKSKKVKLYGYQQPVLQGTQRKTVDESGQTKELPAKTSANYLLYLDVPANIKVDPKHIWIKGKLYGVKTELVNSPVVIKNTVITGKKTDTLVKSSSGSVLLMTLLPLDTQPSTSNSVRKKIKANEIALHTIENGRNCYYYLPALKVLDPVALQ